MKGNFNQMNRKIKKLDTTIKMIWEKDVANDYDHNLILNEDTLKNALYFHLRTCFEKTPELEDFCIFTECTHYGFSALNYTPDMVIVDIKTDKIVAVFELKYKSRDCHYVEDLVYYDIRKLKDYMNTLDTLHIDCQLYITAITLGDFNRPNWLDGRSKWAKEKVTELIAYEPQGLIEFTVIPHN